MGQFDTSLSKAKEVIKFENDRIDKIYSSIERDQWEIKVIAVIESIGDEWNKFLGAPSVEETRLKLEYLTIQSLALIIRDREKLLKKAGPLAFWREIDQQLQEFSNEKNLFPLGTTISILQNAAQSIEEKLTLTEWIIQTPRRWNLKWDSKENLDIKVDYLSSEIKDYQSRLDSTLDKLITDTTPLGQEPFPWPRELNAILLLLKLSAIRKLKSPCIELPDIRLTATLITDPKTCTPVLHQQITAAEKSLEELRKKNNALQMSLQQARAMAESGNHLKALERLKLVPPHFRLNEQREILDLTNKVTQRLTQIEAVRKKLDQMDLQRLDWGAISDFCDEIRATIHNEGDSGSDYEIEASRLLHEINGYLLRHRNSVIMKWSAALGLAALLLLGIYYFYSSNQKVDAYQVEILTANSNVTWSLYRDTGELVQKGKGKATITAPTTTLFLVLRQGNRIGFERALWNGNSFHSFVQNTIFSYPLVRIQALDSTGKNSLDPENYQLRIDRIPVPSDIEGIYMIKGMHRFTIRQPGQPEYDTTEMVSQRNETVSLVSPWVPVDFDANADDLFVSINNSSKRLLPYRFFLPVGNHEAIFSDSRGDIRESRRIHVEGGAEANEELAVSSGTLKIKVLPVRAGLKLIVNGITHSLNQGQRNLSLSTGEQRIQLFINEQLVYEANLALRLGEEIERTINLLPPR